MRLVWVLSVLSVFSLGIAMWSVIYLVVSLILTP